jgi:hypothetical protein
MTKAVQWTERITECLVCGTCFRKFGPAPWGPNYVYAGICQSCIYEDIDGIDKSSK